MNSYHQEAARWHKGQAGKYRTRLSRLLSDGANATRSFKGISQQKWDYMTGSERQQEIDDAIQDTRWWIEAEERNQADAESGTMVPVLEFFKRKT